MSSLGVIFAQTLLQTYLKPGEGEARKVHPHPAASLPNLCRAWRSPSALQGTWPRGGHKNDGAQPLQPQSFVHGSAGAQGNARPTNLDLDQNEEATCSLF